MDIKQLLKVLSVNNVPISLVADKLKCSETDVLKKMVYDEFNNKDIKTISDILNLSGQDIYDIFFAH